MKKNLLIKYISGNANELEKKQVLDWIEKSESNMNYFAELKNLWVYNNVIGNSQENIGNADKINKANFKILSSRISHRNTIKRIINISISAAAAIILFFAIDLSLNPNHRITNPLSTKEQLATLGKKLERPTLLLDNGYSFQLNNNNVAEIKQFTEKNKNRPKSKEQSKDKGITITKKRDNGNSTIEKNTVIIPAGYTYNITLPDSSAVFLSPNSQLRYTAKFDNNAREVDFLGEGYFKVKKSKIPFIVKIGNDIKVTVYGTEFNINTNKSGKVEALLVSGSVGVSNSKGEEIKLSPNELFEYNLISGHSSIKPVNPQDYLAWMKGDFVYDNQPLSVLLDEISAHYAIKIKYNYNVGKMHGSINLSRKLGYLQIMEILEEAMCVKFIKTKQNIYLCEPN